MLNNGKNRAFQVLVDIGLRKKTKGSLPPRNFFHPPKNRGKNHQETK